MVSIATSAMMTIAFMLLGGKYFATSTSTADPKYSARCSIINDDGHALIADIDCQVALFSYANFSINGFLDIRKDSLCNGPNRGNENIGEQNRQHHATSIKQHQIAVIKRGECPFDVKAQNAEKYGYDAVVIVNSEDSVFPVGSADPAYRSRMPCLMIGSAAWARIAEKLDKSNIVDFPTDGPYLKATLHFDKAPPPPSKGRSRQPRLNRFDIARSVASFSLLMIVMLVVSVITSALIPRQRDPISANNPKRWWLTILFLRAITIIHSWLPLLSVCCLFLCLRLSTLRALLRLEDGSYQYNHNETDERIFETLVDSVTRDWRDYALSSQTIAAFRLAEENYAHPIFIHPPLFVYSAAALKHWLGLALPLYPLLCQLLTLLLLPIITHSMQRLDRSTSWCTANDRQLHRADSAEADNDRQGGTGTDTGTASGSGTGLCACVLFACCPIAAFCSQKFWIDNPLLLTVTAAVAVHMSLCATAVVNVTNNDDGPHSAHDVKAVLTKTLPTSAIRRTRNHSDSRVSSLSLQVLSGLFFGGVALNCKITALATLPFLLIWTAHSRVILYLHTHSKRAKRGGMSDDDGGNKCFESNNTTLSRREDAAAQAPSDVYSNSHYYNYDSNNVLSDDTSDCDYDCGTSDFSHSSTSDGLGAISSHTSKRRMTTRSLHKLQLNSDRHDNDGGINSHHSSSHTEVSYNDASSSSSSTMNTTNSDSDCGNLRRRRNRSTTANRDRDGGSGSGKRSTRSRMAVDVLCKAVALFSIRDEDKAADNGDKTADYRRVGSDNDEHVYLKRRQHRQPQQETVGGADLRNRATMSSNAAEQTAAGSSSSATGNINSNSSVNNNGTSRSHVSSLFSLLLPLCLDVCLHWLLFALGLVLGHGLWVGVYWINTGRLLPSAWPSASMINSSTFIQKAINKPWYFYLYQLLTLAPVHLIGLLVGVAACLATLRDLIRVMYSHIIAPAPFPAYVTADGTSPDHRDGRRAATVVILTSQPAYNSTDGTIDTTEDSTTTRRAGSEGSSDDDSDFSLFSRQLLEVLQSPAARVGVLSLWPLGYIVGVSVLGAMGAGYQTRFMLPMIPGTCVLTAQAIQSTANSSTSITTSKTNDSEEGGVSASVVSVNSTIIALVGTLVAYSSLHCLYYGVLFAPLYADLDHSVLDIMDGILRSDYHPPATRDSYEMMMRYMAHFGLTR